MKLADKHRNVIRGISHTLNPNDNIRSDATLLDSLKKKTRVFGVEQQLYKDVDSDHQQRMLHSNIYIPDYDSAKDETHHSTDNLNS
jgi:hypothetical protein